MLTSAVKNIIDQKVTVDFYNDGKLDLFELCQNFGIGVYNADFDNDKVSGMLSKTPEGKWSIYINHNDSPRRKRFTVAHELGHYLSYLANSHSKIFLDSNGSIKDVGVFLRGENTDPEAKVMEAEANAIAAEILMQPAVVKKLVEDNMNVEAMAEYFGVSDSAMTFRLMNLGYKLLEEQLPVGA